MDELLKMEIIEGLRIGITIGIFALIGFYLTGGFYTI